MGRNGKREKNGVIADKQIQITPKHILIIEYA